MFEKEFQEIWLNNLYKDTEKLHKMVDVRRKIKEAIISKESVSIDIKESEL